MGDGDQRHNVLLAAARRQVEHEQFKLGGLLAAPRRERELDARLRAPVTRNRGATPGLALVDKAKRFGDAAHLGDGSHQLDVGSDKEASAEVILKESLLPSPRPPDARVGKEIEWPHAIPSGDAHSGQPERALTKGIDDRHAHSNG